MKKLLLSAGLCSAPFFNLLAQVQQAPSIDEQIDTAVGPTAQFISNIIFYEYQLTDNIGVPLILLWLIIGALFFTIYLGFINFRGFKHSLDIVRGKYNQVDAPGEITHFQALTAALSGTVGLGNIAGVAIAISIGGPGATFWMIVAGLLGMSTKFVECTLGVKYRDTHPDGTVSGGPMHYLNKGLKEKGMGKLGKFLAGFFALMCIGGSFGAGNMFQINQATEQFVGVTGGANSFFGSNAWMFGLIMAVLVALVILGGMKSIARVTEKIVPLMCGIYVLAAIVVLLSNVTQLPAAFTAIFEGAFSGSALGGGIIGSMIQGLRRGVFSNEAGVGSASIAHSAVKTNVPVTEGFVACLEPFVDTVVVCTMTALVIIVTGTYGLDTGGDGIALTSASFATVISWFPLVLAVAVILFAFSTMITWSYYGLKSWTYLFGNNKIADISFKIIFCGFIVLGASMQLGNVVAFSDAMIFAMAIPNIVGLYLLAPVVKSDMQAFLSFARSSKEQPLTEEAIEAEKLEEV